MQTDPNQASGGWGRSRRLLTLAAAGATLGPVTDAIHNQVLLAYDVMPVQLPVLGFVAKTSLIIPPLLAITYCLLGGIFPPLVSSAGHGATAVVPGTARGGRAVSRDSLYGVGMLALSPVTQCWCFNQSSGQRLTTSVQFFIEEGNRAPVAKTNLPRSFDMSPRKPPAQPHKATRHP